MSGDVTWAACVCADIAPADRPCLVCAARAADAPEPTACKACATPVWWLTHARTGHLAPIETTPHAQGNIEILPEQRYRVLPADERRGRTDLHLNHFAACPEAPTFSRRARPVVVAPTHRSTHER